jgi:hypothetical protein
MDKDSKNQFTLIAENGHFSLKITEVFGFPKSTSHWGGYDTHSVLDIRSSNYLVRGSLFISTGELYTFYEQLKKCFASLVGSAKLISSEDNLRLEVTFDEVGHVTTKGAYKEQHFEGNELLFEMTSDQTYLSQTLIDLKNIVDIYGNMEGTR